MSTFSYNQEALKNLHIEDTTLLDRLVDFESARAVHLKKARGKVDKRISLKEAGLIANGPLAVISQWGIYDFEPETKRMRIKSLTPGIPFDIAQQSTGFELLKPDGDIPETAMIPPDVLDILRTEVDPGGVFTTMPS